MAAVSPMKSVCSQVFSQIFEEEHHMEKDRNKVFSFVHQSIVEFLAALYVVLSPINTNISHPPGPFPADQPDL